MSRTIGLLMLFTAVLAAGCGSTSSPGYGVREVERVFLEAGVPFQEELRPAPASPYLRPLSDADPFKQLAGDAKGLEAILIATNPKTFASRIAFVFDPRPVLTWR